MTVLHHWHPVPPVDTTSDTHTEVCCWCGSTSTITTSAAASPYHGSYVPDVMEPVLVRSDIVDGPVDPAVAHAVLAAVDAVVHWEPQP